MLYRKGIYPHEYMSLWERFSETTLPGKDMFYSKLNDEHITDEEHAHTQRVCEALEGKTLGDYHDLYVKTDVALLADHSKPNSYIIYLHAKTFTAGQ